MKRVRLTFFVFIFLVNGCITGSSIRELEGPFVVTNAVDGDTFDFGNNERVRMSGINTPETGECYYKEAKEKLAELILHKEIYLERDRSDKDKYERLLRYVFVENENINLELVENGLANPYIYDTDKYTQSLRDAWLTCIKENKNLCEKSKDECADCVELEELDVKSQTLILYNSCNFPCSLEDWTIKDEGRKKFVFPDFILKSNNEVKIKIGNETDTESVLFWKGKDYIWTFGGDTLFLRDSEGKLVLWESY